MNIMKTRNKLYGSTILTTLFAILFLCINTAEGNDKKSVFQELERMEDQNMEYLNSIYEIVDDYPQFSYRYIKEDGKVKRIEITGVDNAEDAENLEVLMINLNTNRNKMKNKRNRLGVFYSVDKKAHHKDGREDYNREILMELTVPEELKDLNVHGTIYTYVVVDEEGEIPFLSFNSHLKNTDGAEWLVDKLKEDIKKVIKASSGDWIPAKIDGVEVASMVRIPIEYEIDKDPSIKAWVR